MQVLGPQYLQKQEPQDSCTHHSWRRAAVPHPHCSQRPKFPSVSFRSTSDALNVCIHPSPDSKEACSLSADSLRDAINTRFLLCPWPQRHPLKCVAPANPRLSGSSWNSGSFQESEEGSSHVQFPVVEKNPPGVTERSSPGCGKNKESEGF